MSNKINDLNNRLAADIRSTQELRARFKDDPKAGLKQAAQEFESMFMQMVLKSMRDATPQDGPFNSDETRFYTSMLDQQMAQKMASGQGMGFARMIEQQLGKHLGLPASMPAGDGPAIPAAGNVSPLTGSETGHLRQPPPAPARAAAIAEVQKMVDAAEGPAAASPKEFVNRVWPHAVEVSRSTGIPPQFLVAHAALESGWGRSEMRRADGSSAHNLFGIKAGRSWSGPTVETQTTEFINGESQRVTARFRAYSSYGEAFRDYANLLRNNPRFGAVIGSQDGTEFARRLQQAGYATDPMYADKLSRIIQGPTLRQALIG
ncbi:MAG TPA: flagellar assembly peptidoglycan hydrolase FlgJ [Rhodocyclaceae bacterium]|nr:flagellar assembly peptidoglycan hydrolase FlgJ [Rhodocyclaceae bacterium]